MIKSAVRNRSKVYTSQRRGIATLELVMSLPILIFLIAMLFTVYFATMKKSQLTMEVRNNAWRPRANPDAGKAAPFGLLKSHQSGTERAELTRRVTSYTNLYPNVPRKITWGNVVLTGAWDKKQVDFRGSSPHMNVLLQMILAQGGVNANPSQARALNGLLNFPGM